MGIEKEGPRLTNRAGRRKLASGSGGRSQTHGDPADRDAYAVILGRSIATAREPRGLHGDSLGPRPSRRSAEDDAGDAGDAGRERPSIRARVKTILAELKALGSEENRRGQARFGINTARAYGVSIANLRPFARRLQRDHELAAALWATGVHEARILAAFIDEPAKVTWAQMDEWAAEFDSWDLCDQVCMALFDRTPHVEKKIRKWAKDSREFVRRAAFALLAGYAVHAKGVGDDTFLPLLDLIEKHATDPRNFVRKAVNWALRQIGKRSTALHPPALALAEKLAASDDKTACWIGKDAVRELSDPKQIARLQARCDARAGSRRRGA